MMKLDEFIMMKLDEFMPPSDEGFHSPYLIFTHSLRCELLVCRYFCSYSCFSSLHFSKFIVSIESRHLVHVSDAATDGERDFGHLNHPAKIP